MELNELIIRVILTRNLPNMTRVPHAAKHYARVPTNCARLARTCVLPKQNPKKKHKIPILWLILPIYI